jgi:hypothetical protein
VSSPPTRPGSPANLATPLDESRTAGAKPGVVEYDLHGIVGIRLEGAAPPDVGAVSSQLGLTNVVLARDPDIVVRFVSRLATSTTVRYLGLDDAGFTDDAFFVVQRTGNTRLRAGIAFEQLGTRSEIVCESGIGPVPFLIPILNLAMLAKGYVPIHAAAFTYGETGALVTGWAKGGKTELLLGFMARGARYVGDEWVYVDRTGSRMYGIPEPIRLWDWHLDDLPWARARIGWRARARLHSIKAAVRAGVALPQRLNGTAVGRIASRAAPLAERQLNVLMEPQRLFGPDSCALEGPLDKVFFVVSHESSDVVVAPADPEDVARRVVFSLTHERLELLDAYGKARFAHPALASPFLDGADQLERDLLQNALGGKETYSVHHPFPAPIPALADAVLPLL